MTTLIIGGAGFIGQHVTRLLAERGESVICMDMDTDPAQDALPGQPVRDRTQAGQPARRPYQAERVRHVRGDITNFDDLSAVISRENPQCIINLAYLMGEGEQKPHLAVRVNVLGMSNALEAARLHGIRRIVYASSIAYHGDAREPSGERPVREDDPPGASALLYSSSKQFAEALAGHFNRLYGLEAIAVRPCFVMGEGKPRGIQDYVSIITEPAQGRPVRLSHKPGARFLLAYVEDVAEAFVRVALAEKPRHAVYHTGGHSVTMTELAEIVREFIPEAQITFDEETGADGLFVHNVDNSRISQEFSFQHRPLRQIVQEMITATRQQTSVP